MTEAELIVVNGDIRTMDPLFPRVSAIAVTGGRISALGSDADIRQFGGLGTRVIDAGGRLVLPGLQDTHIHLQDSGYGYGLSANLDRARSIEELQSALVEFAKQHEGEWVDGVGWYTGVFTGANLNRQVLDAAVAGRPCFVLASDGHNACMNSLACEAVGLKRGTPDPANGHFVVDGDGNPTGMLHEAAITWAEERMPLPSDADFAQGVLFGQALCNRHGITGALDASVNERHARIYRNLEKAGKLSVRVRATARVDPAEKTHEALARVEALRREHQSEMFTIHSAKFFLDGVLENRTATMLAPYSDPLGRNAPLMFGHNQLKELFTVFDAARFQIHAACHRRRGGARRARRA